MCPLLQGYSLAVKYNAYDTFCSPMLLVHLTTHFCMQQQNAWPDLQPYQKGSNKNTKENSNKPSDMKSGDAVKAVPNSCLHLASHLQLGKIVVMSLHFAPVLLDKIELAVILGVEVTEMAIPSINSSSCDF